MATTAAREQSYLKALMFLGPRPRAPRPIHQVHDEYVLDKGEQDVYQTQMSYDSAVLKYFMKHIFQGPTSALGNTDEWISDFYHWQRLHACKGEDHESNPRPQP